MDDRIKNAREAAKPGTGLPEGTVRGLVSIIIPTHNSEDYVCQAVDSCLSQTYRLVEIIVVDDGSTDGTRQRLKSYADRGEIIYIYQENGERSRARNRGLNQARGEFIQFLDDDDLLEKEKLEKQAAFLKENPGCFGVYCAASHFGEVEEKFRRYPRPHAGVITRDIIRGNFILINTMLTRRAEVRFDENFRTLEDWYYWFQISLGRRKFGYIAEKLCRVRRHVGNTSKDGLAMLRGELAVLDKMESAGVFSSEVRYYRFERMYLLGMKGSWRTMGKAAAMDGRKIFACLGFLTKTAARKILIRKQ
jgi:glycosyltransferase involved in cell wall biosynthesis